ncbi:MAG: hypothetical protein HY821_10130 [Acidobacteria bacterium]|nr:hypothetical protein [Acidobacteriota bacterium]
MMPQRSECGIGALMPWADSLWAVTYNSHMKGSGSGLALYRIDENLKTERVHVHDGTHANRLIHHESNQCFIGPYVIDAKGNWKFIPEFDRHRLTSTMRHLTDPANKVYYQTMEGLFLEMDVNDHKPRVLFDLVKQMKLAARPHFKGGFTAQGRVVVANNGFYEFGEDQAGLFEFDGKSWNRLSGKPHMDVAARQDMGSVMFATGWDEASVLFWALVKGKWQRFRLPKATHAMSQAWQTEWMRIREVETEHYLMDIQGMFYELQPIAFLGHIWGVKPICQHLRIIPDYCSFRGLFAVSGNQATPNRDNNAVVGQPQAGIWFGKTDDLWSWGKPAGWGGPWWDTQVTKGVASDPYLMTGFDKKMLHISTDKAADFDIEIDFIGTGQWKPYGRVSTGSEGYARHIFPDGFSAHWVRLTPGADCRATAAFFYN